MASHPLLIRRLYRSLLKSAAPFCDVTASPTKAKVLTCLLHRTGFEDESWASFLRDSSIKRDEDDYSSEEDDDDDPSSPQLQLFRNLLREVVAGGSIRQMQWPAVAVPSRLKTIIRREFRNAVECQSKEYSNSMRQSVAFMALAALNKKLAWYESLRKAAPHVKPQQAAAFVAPLPLAPPQAYLRPGAYLIANPHLTGYFRRAVICILDHKEEQDAPGSFGTYGLIVNRVRASPRTQKSLTLEEVIRPLPKELALSFGGSVVKEGGPVHMSLQMLHSITADQEELRIGGCPIAAISNDNEDHQRVLSAIHSDRAIYFKGDVLTAANAVMSGSLDREDVTFFVGASAWQPGQLESEIERGCWLPCRGPPEIAFSSSCEHELVAKGEARPLADLWLSMLSSCGEAEAELAHLLSVDDGENELGNACDDEY